MKFVPSTLLCCLWLFAQASAAQPQPPQAAPAPRVEPAPKSSSAPMPVPAPETAVSAEPEADAAGAGEPVALPGSEGAAAERPLPDAELGAPLEAVAVVPSGLSIDTIPRNVARISRSVLDQEHPLGVHDAMNARLGSVVVNDVQNNPLQPDLQYRGFTASPLLGSPQGLAVYQNGVRLNDPFGDIVQWDLVAEFAIDEVQWVPGADPLHGLNALGGGLALRMKDGFRFDGYRVAALAGSFGRYQSSAEWGRADGELAFYAGVSAFDERGFRDESRSSARHAYADVRQRGPLHEVGVNVSIADTDLRGNGLSPIELLRSDRSAIFTFPDITRNEQLLVAADAKRELAQDIELQANVYMRQLTRDTVNGDEAEFDSCDDGTGVLVLCDESAMQLSSEAGAAVPVTRAFTGVYNTTQTESDGFGGSAQVKLEQTLLGRPNQLLVGAGYVAGTTDFLQRVELGRLTQERSVAGEGIFLADDGFRTKLGVQTHLASIFLAETFTLIDPVAIQLSARAHYMTVTLDDRAGTALDGEHDFARLDPAIGITYRPTPRMTLFASYSESSRAPSAIELACADPDEPCRVPNAFVADPPLDQVVTRGLEAGMRGEFGGTHARPTLSWSVAGFGSRNYDDIIFVAGSRIGTGYFRNAGQTQRIGLELGVTAQAGPLRAYASYALLQATFESTLVLPGAANPGSRIEPQVEAPGDEPGDEEQELEQEEEEGGVIDVEPGDRIPGLPTHSLKAGVAFTLLPKLELGVSAIAQSARPFRGDEANLLDAVPGHAVLGAHIHYSPLDALQLFIKAQNVLDSEYETFGLLADPSEVLEGTSNPRFLSPGAPFGIWAGLVLRGY
jgi:iron complex outermembrane recepter protein